MAIQFIEGFEGYGNATDLGLIFQNTTAVSIGTGPYGGKALVYSGSIPTPIFLPVVTPVSQLYAGFHMIQTNPGVTSDYYAVRFNDVGNSVPQITITFNNPATSGANGIQVFRGDTGVNQIGSTNNFYLQPNVWYYVEVYCLISSSSGTVTVNVNGNQVFTVTGVNTQGGTTGNIGGIGWKVNGTMSIDDLYVLDTTGSTNNTFLCPQNGDLSVVRPALSSNVVSSGWTSASEGSTSSNPAFQQVSNIPLQYDAAYITASTAGSIDSFTVNGYTPIDQCFASQISYVARKDNAGIKTLKSFIQTGSTVTNFPSIVQSVHQRSTTSISMTLSSAVTVGNKLIIIGTGAPAEILSNVAGFTTVVSETIDGVGAFIGYLTITSTAQNTFSQSGLTNYMNYTLMEVANCTGVIGYTTIPTYANNSLSAVIQMPFDSYFYGIFGVTNGPESWTAGSTTIDYDFQQGSSLPGTNSAVAVKASYSSAALTVNVLPDSVITSPLLAYVLLTGVISSGTVANGGSNNLSASYVQYRDVFPTDASGNPWTITTLTDLVIGIDVIQ